MPATTAAQLKSWAGKPSLGETSGRKIMFDCIVQTSEALRRAAERGSGTLFPALCGCEACETTQLIATPSIGICAVCGAELTVLTSASTSQASDQEPEVLSPFAA
jgi:hypothetical protein